MGGGESKPAKVPWTLHIYVTNQTKDVKHIFVRVRGDKVKESEIYNRIMNETSFGLEVEGQAAAAGKDMAGAKGTGKVNYHHKHEKEEKERRIYSNLTQGGFSYLPFGETMPFPAENDDQLMYVSVHDGDKMWCTDTAVDPKRYGCITIKGDREGISVAPSNPKPCWVEWEENDSSFSTTNLVEVKQRSNKIPVYLGKAIWPGALLDQEQKYVLVCEVWQENGKLCAYPGKVSMNVIKAPIQPSWAVAASFIPIEFSKVKVLSATKYEWVKAERGNPVPVNAVTVSVKDGSQHVYLGRANGDTACGITEVDGMFDQFIASKNIYSFGKELIASSGEVLLLTAEPILP